MIRHERVRSRGEEIASALTHGCGLAVCIAAVPALVVAAWDRADRWLLAGCIVFGATLLLLYATSTCYHAVCRPVAKRRLRMLDHAAIYLLIAGTYTPFVLGPLRQNMGWTLCWAVWGMAGLGVLYKLLLGPRFPLLSTLSYLAMGWLAVLVLRPLSQQLPGSGLVWLVAGGLLYTVGVGFFLWDRARYGHAVWHGFVLAGSACHYWAVFAYAIPPA
jgi:hemolysin III